MEKIRIVGGKALEGTVRISGAKNASLPDVCASILTDQAVILNNVPEVRDIRTMGRVLSAMGVETDIRVGGVVELKAGKLTSVEATYDLVKTMRASVLVLGPCWRGKAAPASPCPAAAPSATGPSTFT
jgi:UDP-N-acetylglucosamine 1-carboxyvinyltransferase